MIVISKITIRRFRSINSIDLKLKSENNLITLCGENNVGKTNVLRALNLFFNPSIYDPAKDSPYHKFYGSRGGSVYPQIEIEFKKNDDVYNIIKTFDITKLATTKGTLKKSGQKKINLLASECDNFIKEIKFFFIESINLSIPKVINELIDVMYDYEYQKSKFSGAKKNLKDSYENYVDGLQSILSALADEIKPSFEKYKSNWGVSFDIQKDIVKFRELITSDVRFMINDKSNHFIDAKGAGLQRLAYILLHFRLISKIVGKSVILLIDEPDVYLHEGMQYGLYEDIRKIQDLCQVFITTHSKVFIDTKKMENVFLLDLKIDEKTYTRRGQIYNVLNTELIDISSSDGTSKIKNHLGIVNEYEDIIMPYNIIVEGESDKKYLVELLDFFHLPIPNFIVANGVDKIVKYLEFYDSYYKNDNLQVKKKILVLVDNDNAGRTVLSSLKKKKFNYLNIKFDYVPTYLGDLPFGEDKFHLNNMNWQIEDFVYPEVLTYLTNIILKRKSMRPISYTKIVKKIGKSAFKNNGILALFEYEKNECNQDTGNDISFVSSGLPTEQIKVSISNLFKLEGNKTLAELVSKGNLEYPEVYKFLMKICNESNYFM